MKNFLLTIGMLALLSPGRLCAAIEISFDYRFDTLGFFNDPVRRAALESVGRAYNSMHHDIPAMVPGEGNTWSWTFQHPGNGESLTVNNAVIPSNHIIVYALGAPLSGGELGKSAKMNIQASGSEDWLDSIDAWGSDYGPWGGFVTFDSSTNWSFSEGPPTASQMDFISVASHEIGHLLGFSSGIEAFDRMVSDGKFAGPSVQAVMGGPVPLSFDQSHFAQSTRFEGRMPTMLPTIAPGEMQRLTALDFAAFKDIGWQTDPALLPEPSTWALIGVGVIAVVAGWRRRGPKPLRF